MWANVNERVNKRYLQRLAQSLYWLENRDGPSTDTWAESGEVEKCHENNVKIIFISFSFIVFDYCPTVFEEESGDRLLPKQTHNCLL